MSIGSPRKDFDLKLLVKATQVKVYLNQELDSHVGAVLLKHLTRITVD